MKILPLGVGNAFTEKYFHNNFFIKLQYKNLLLDAGTTLRYSLPHAQLDVQKIDYIFITHTHSDHFGGLEELLLKCHWNFVDGVHTPLRPTLLMHPRQYEDFIMRLTPTVINDGHTLEHYCEVVLCNDQQQFLLDGYLMQLIDLTNLHIKGMVNFGLKLTEQVSGSNVIFSSDVKHLENSGLREAIDANTRAIIQDTSFSPNGVHATIEEILGYYPKQCHSLLYATHYDDSITESDSPIQLLLQGQSLSFK